MPRPGWRVNVAELLLDDRRARHGDRIAVRTPDGAVTTGELARRVESIAATLIASGVGRGSRVCLVAPDSVEWIATFLALARLGALTALASPALPPEMLADVIERAQPDAVICDAELVRPPRHTIDLDLLARSARHDPPISVAVAATRATDPCYALLTSGSTGPPKWAVHSHGDMGACLATYGRHVLRLAWDDIVWSVAALPTSYGLGNSLYFPLGAGASAWITGLPPSPLEAARACADGGTTVIGGVPTFWSRLARHVQDGRVPAGAFRSLRIGISAGEPLPPAVWHAVRDATGIELVDGLGSSEATNLYLSNRPHHARPGSVGTVVPGFTLRVTDESGCEVADGLPGELLVRGPSLMSGYLDAPDATANTLRGGWLHTGDLVIRSDDASYAFVGRIGERFKSGASWVDPSRVESVLIEHPAVSEVGVAGVVDDRGLARVAAAIVPRPDADPAMIRDRLARLAALELRPHERPRDYLIVDALPTAASGKVRRDVLREVLQQIGGDG